VSSGIEKTFSLLAKTKNQASIGVLVSAMDLPFFEIRDTALSSLLQHRGLIAQRAIIDRWSNLTASQKSWIEAEEYPLESGTKEYLRSQDKDRFYTALEIVHDCDLFDLMPMMVHIVADSRHPHREKAGATLIQMASALWDESTRHSTDKHYGVGAIRIEVVDALETAIRHYEDHRSQHLLEAYLILATRENRLLREIWSDVKHPAHAPILRLMRHSTRAEIIELTVSVITDPHPLMPVLNLIGLRYDVPFMEALTKQIPGEISGDVKRNLGKLHKVHWAEEHHDVLEKLSPNSQAAGIHVAMATSVGSERLHAMLVAMTGSEHADCRLAALEELASFVDPTTNEIMLDAVNDPNISVRAEALRQIRPRGITGAIKLLLEHLASPELLIQDTVRKALAEFSFPRYLSAFEKMSPDAQINTGKLVCDIDLQSPKLLAVELRSEATARTMRAFRVLESLGLHPQLEEHLLELLQHDDHLVRAEAASALAHCHSSSDAISALREAMLDRNARVRENASQSLRKIVDGKQVIPKIDTESISESNATR